MSGLAERLDRSGFVGPLQIFAPGECRRWLRRLDQAPMPVEWPKSRAVEAWDFFEAATREAILDPLEEMLGPDLLLWGASLISRRPGQVHHWHTDAETSSPEAAAVSVWIGLHHTNERSSLLVVPGSHRYGITVQDARRRAAGNGDVEDDEEVLAWARGHDPASRIESVPVRDGEALFFDGRLWHSSRNRNRLGTRTALLLQYATPATPIRTADRDRYEDPLETRGAGRPPCLLVRGGDDAGVNRLVEPPRPRESGTTGETRLPTEVHEIALPLARDPQRGWRPHSFFRGATAGLDRLTCHASVLEPGSCPHEPHEHPDEEILLVLDGEAELVVVVGDGASERTHLLAAGGFDDYPAGARHTIRSPGPDPVTYLMLKWRAVPRRGVAPDREPRLCPATGAVAPAGEVQDLSTERLLAAPTRFLEQVRAHRTTLQPGAGYPPHRDPYDVAIVLLSGRLEIEGRARPAPCVAFHPAGRPHGLRNVGDEPARYLVFELRGSRSEGPIRTRLRAMARRLPRGLRVPLARALRAAGVRT